MKFRALVFLTLLLTVLPLMATAQDRILYDFDAPDAARSWRAVTDGVMGGRSVGRITVNEDNQMEFFGTLSLENNGGFTSVRATETRYLCAERRHCLSHCILDSWWRLAQGR